MPASLPRPADNIRHGIGFMLVAVSLFSVLNVLVKTLAAGYPVAEVAFFRNLFALPLICLMVAMGGGWDQLRTRRLGAHLWRSAIGVTCMLLLFLAFDLLPLADAVAYSFAAPLFVTALSVPLLGERVGLHRWGAVVVGFVGVLLMLRPGGEVLNLGALAALAAALCQALAMVAIRQLTRTEAPLVTVFYFTVFSTLLTGLLLPLGWRTPLGWDLALAVSLGVVGGIAQYCLTRAHALAPAALVAPFNYMALLWSVLFGFVIWGDVPEPLTMAGAAVVMASGLFILYRESRRGSRLPAGVSATVSAEVTTP